MPFKDGTDFKKNIKEIFSCISFPVKSANSPFIFTKLFRLLMKLKLGSRNSRCLLLFINPALIGIDPAPKLGGFL